MRKILFLFVFIILISFVSAKDQWDLTFQTEKLGEFRSLENYEVPYFAKAQGNSVFLIFNVDNLNENALPNYESISKDNNDSYVGAYVIGKDEDRARVYSPEQYKPGTELYVGYNVKRRIVVELVLPKGWNNDLTYQTGLRVVNRAGDQRQILVNVYFKEKASNRPFIILGIIGGIALLIFIIIVGIKKIQEMKRNQNKKVY
ncbi:MAG: hypothetical protein WC781_05440 [Candidatus Pacearchaeota archaeon]|jgi:hypothetical protein